MGEQSDRYARGRYAYSRVPPPDRDPGGQHEAHGEQGVRVGPRSPVGEPFAAENVR